jgi:hypothetical protein
MSSPRTKTDAQLLTEEDIRYDKIALSLIGGVTIGFFGLLAGAAWERAIGKKGSGLARKIGGFSIIWGTIVVHLTRSGGRTPDNRTPVDFAMLALYGWIAYLACFAALLVWTLRTFRRRGQGRS